MLTDNEVGAQPKTLGAEALCVYFGIGFTDKQKVKE